MSLRGSPSRYAVLHGPTFAFLPPWSKPPFLVCKRGLAPCPFLCSSKVRKPLKTQSVPEPLLQAQRAVSPPSPAPETAPAHGPALPQQIRSQISCEPKHQGWAGLSPGSRVSACGLSRRPSLCLLIHTPWSLLPGGAPGCRGTCSLITSPPSQALALTEPCEQIMADTFIPGVLLSISK